LQDHLVFLLLKQASFLVFHRIQQSAATPHRTKFLWVLRKDFIHTPNKSSTFPGGLTNGATHYGVVSFRMALPSIPACKGAHGLFS
jgi:hypothetical protein